MRITEYFASLGSTADEVAAALQTQGATGLRRSSCDCPILRGVYLACPDYWAGLRIYGGIREGQATYWATIDDPQITDPVLPQPVVDFIAAFDQGKYPQLEWTPTPQVAHA